ncbi:MAG: preprotein translocase subunit SecA [Myxococcales bacterium]|nr:preprotein translocase subunit SecA [Myxococcales bacterium]
MISSLIKKIFGSSNDRTIKRMQPLVAKINELESKIKSLSDDDLKAQTSRFREQLSQGAPLDSLLPEAFATVREASRRVLGMRHYDVQLLGGITLHNGSIAEMRTGEGKTLVATLPVYLNALPASGVHVVTVNDYLASRDADWMGQIYRYLGMTVGVVVQGITDQVRQDAYRSDITYGQNNEFGFDYLRDNMKFSLADCAQRPLNYAIVDEVDSILIDEARTPLIISGRAEKSTDLYYKVNDLIRPLKRDQDFLVDEKAHACTLTEVGVDKIERKMKLDNLYAPDQTELLHHIHQALKAHALYKRDVNYLVEEGKVIIVDEFTGRKMPGRRWSDGLHQAVEAKEGLKIQDESQTLATITFQNYFRMYKKLAGMTGTADTEAEEFANIYNLDVVVIPTNQPVIRKDFDDVVYTKERGKLYAVIDDVIDAHKRGQPVLVGTTSVEKSDFISRMLSKNEIAHNVLNAKFHAREAQIVAQAGRLGAVTIATNMAGRGTDILLGGNPAFLARAEVGADADEQIYQETLTRFSAICAEERVRVLQAGGLYIIGTERHESRRIDNQLRGRAGRQGDPGASRFYLSLEDDLLRIFNAERIQKMMERFNVPDNEPIEHRWVTKAIESAQRKVEARNFDIRKNLLEYDDVMNQQRKSVYELRRDVLTGSDPRKLVFAAVDDAVERLVEVYTNTEASPGEWDIAGLKDSIRTVFRIDVDIDSVPRKAETLVENIAKQIHQVHVDREEQLVRNMLRSQRYEIDERYAIAKMQAELQGKTIGDLVVDEEKLRELKLKDWHNYIRVQYLQSVDTLWKDHLQAMAHLKEGIHLHAYAQKDPKIIYKQEAYDLFAELIGQIRQRVVETLFQHVVHSEQDVEKTIRTRKEALDKKLLEVRNQHQQAAETRAHEAARAHQSQTQDAAQEPARPKTIVREGPKIGRNDLCHCGSGKKYKKCCLPKEEAEAEGTMAEM